MNVEVLISKQVDKDTVSVGTYYKLFATDYDISDETNVTKSEAMTGNRFGGGNTFVSGISVSGGIPVEWNAEGLMYILEGAGFTTDEVASPYTFNEADSVDNYYTVILNNKRDASHSISAGCKINSLTINMASESYVTGTVDFIGLVPTKQSSAFAGTVANFTDEPMKCLDMLVKFDTVDQSCKLESFELTINNNLEPFKCLNGLYNEDMQDGTGEMTATATFNALHKTDFINGFNNMIAGTPVAIELTLADPDAPGTDTAVISLPRAFVTSNDDGDYGGTGSLSQNFNIEYDSTAGHILEAVFTNIDKY